MVTVTPAYGDTLTWGGGWTSLDYPWMVTVTPAYGDTLTWSGRGEGGHPWTIRGWSQLLSAKYKATVSSMDDSGLSTAPLDISAVLAVCIAYNLYANSI